MNNNINLQDLKMIVGPMEGVMTPALIMASNKLGLTKSWMTPFLRISSQIYPDKFVKNFVNPYLYKDCKVIIQLMSQRSNLLVDTISQLQELGLGDGYNLNFGCPSKKVMSGNCGGAALKDIQLMVNLISEIRKHHPKINLSAKIRLGYSDINEMQKIIPAITKDNLLDFIVVHCRTVKEHYTKIEHHQARFLQAIELAQTTPVVINGDIDSRILGNEYVQSTNAVGFMSARPWLKNPFMFVKDEFLESDKELFYHTVLEVAEDDLGMPYSIGKKIELSNFIFTMEKNPYFEELKKQNIMSPTA